MCTRDVSAECDDGIISAIRACYIRNGKAENEVLGKWARGQILRNAGGSFMKETTGDS